MITRYSVHPEVERDAGGFWCRWVEVKFLELDLEKTRKEIDRLNELLGKAQDEKLLGVFREIKLKLEIGMLKRSNPKPEVNE